VAQRDTRTLVAHLFRRAGFGLRPDELDHYTSLGVQRSVDYLTNYDGVVDAADQSFPPPDLSADYTAPLPAAQRTTATQKQQGHLRGQAKIAIQEWWLNRMLSTTVPLREKMTLFWHGHFATAISKSPAPFMLQQNQLFRSMALGNFNTLLKAVTQDPAMLVWLDGDQNRAGKPNENYARESMELFTIGVGNFTEPDVREGARALTGWILPRHAYADAWNGGQTVAHLAPRLHDTGVKTYLGHTGNLGSDDVANILTAHPHAGPFLVRQLFSFFASDSADTATIQPFVDTYYSTKYDIKAVMRQILLSDAFYSDAAFQQRISSPTEFVVGATRELGATVPIRRMTQALALMGQDLFNPPNVGGWPGGVTWINASTLVERFNFAGVVATALARTDSLGTLQQALAISGGATTQIGSLLNQFIGVGSAPATQNAVQQYLAGSPTTQDAQARARGVLQLALGSPEYQLN